MHYQSMGMLSILALLATSGIAPAAAQTRPLPKDRPQTQPSRPRPPANGPQILPSLPSNPGGQVRPPRPPEVLPTPPNNSWNPGRPPRPNYPNGQVRPPSIGNGYTLRCESYRNRRQRCAAATQNQVRLVRRLGGTCSQGRTWGYDRRSIWVDRGCRAEFSYGRWAGGGGGGHYPQPDRDRPNTGKIIAGVAIAGGLIALLASSANRKAQNDSVNTTGPTPPESYPAGPPASLVADLSPLPANSRASVLMCLNEASRQIGATGGTRLSYDRLVSLEPGNGGWRFGASLTASYPDGNRVLPLYCRATPTKIIQLDFTNG